MEVESDGEVLVGEEEKEDKSVVNRIALLG